MLPRCSHRDDNWKMEKSRDKFNVTPLQRRSIFLFVPFVPSWDS